MQFIDSSAEQVHITEINDTSTNLSSSLDQAQLAIGDDTGKLAYKDSNGNFFELDPAAIGTSGFSGYSGISGISGYNANPDTFNENYVYSGHILIETSTQSDVGDAGSLVEPIRIYGGVVSMTGSVGAYTKYTLIGDTDTDSFASGACFVGVLDIIPSKTNLAGNGAGGIMMLGMDCGVADESPASTEFQSGQILLDSSMGGMFGLSYDETNVDRWYDLTITEVGAVAVTLKRDIAGKPRLEIQNFTENDYGFVWCFRGAIVNR